MGKLHFYDEAKKRVGFQFKSIKEINTFLQLNPDATLIVDFSELLLSNDQKSTDFSPLDPNHLHHLLFISKPVDKRYQLQVFENLPQLISLDDRSPINQINYNFLHYPRLEELLLSWDKSFKNLASCISLKELSLWHYKPAQKNLMEWSSLENLEELRIVQSAVDSAIGIESLTNLQRLIFIANRTLHLKELKDPLPQVKELYIESCSHISIKEIPSLFPNLEKLTFQNKEEIDSLKEVFIGLPKLNQLNVYQLKILEKDNRYWKEYTNLIEFNFANRNHQLLKREDFDNV